MDALGLVVADMVELDLDFIEPVELELSSVGDFDCFVLDGAEEVNLNLEPLDVLRSASSLVLSKSFSLLLLLVKNDLLTFVVDAAGCVVVWLLG